MTDDAIAQLSDQLLAISTRLQELESSNCIRAHLCCWYTREGNLTRSYK
jgi:hypothetical protein